MMDSRERLRCRDVQGACGKIATCAANSRQAEALASVIVVLYVVSIVAFSAVLFYTGVTELKRGETGFRWGVSASRDKNPALFWFGIAVKFVSAGGGAWLAVFIALHA